MAALPLHPASCWYCLLLLGFTVSYVNMEAFTSTTQLKQLAVNTDFLISRVEDYVLKEEQRLQEIRRLLNETRQARPIVEPEHALEFVGHPTNAYKLIQHWYTLGAKVTETSSVEDLRSLLQASGVPLVTDVDSVGASSALLRLQRVYNLTTDQLAEGSVYGQIAAPLTPLDLFNIGKLAEGRGEIDLAAKWLSKVVESPPSPEVPMAETLTLLAKAYYQIGDYPVAAKYITDALEIEPENATIKMYYEIYKINNETLFRTRDGVPYRTLESYQRFLPTWKVKYEALCRGDEFPKDPAQQKLLKCGYRYGPLPYIRYKEEVLNRDPRLSLIYEIISDGEIELLQTLATPIMNRAAVGDPAKVTTTEERISKVGWLWDTGDEPRILHLSRRVEWITGLSTQYRPELSSAEPFQVVNYGLGGQYEPHKDYFENPTHRSNVPYFLQHTGERMVTFMFYLSDVTAGGATVFTEIEARVPPIKGAAAFWYNMKRSGELDPRTQHAGCPVLIGEKWVANKWIRERGQEFRRPCGLREEALEEDYEAEYELEEAARKRQFLSEKQPCDHLSPEARMRNCGG